LFKAIYAIESELSVMSMRGGMSRAHVKRLLSLSSSHCRRNASRESHTRDSHDIPFGQKSLFNT
jgi:hypothetical protein